MKEKRLLFNKFVNETKVALDMIMKESYEANKNKQDNQIFVVILVLVEIQHSTFWSEMMRYLE